MVPDFERIDRGLGALLIIGLACALVTLLVRQIVLEVRRPPDEGKVVAAPEFGCVATLLTFIGVMAVG